jgi:hypothetical protein
MKLRAQARIMAQYGGCREPVVPSTTENSPLLLLEQWYHDPIFLNYALEYKTRNFIGYQLLRALKGVTDDEYIAFRRNRGSERFMSETRKINGVMRSYRQCDIHLARRFLRDSETRLKIVVTSLPFRAGLTVDQDHFDLRDCYDLSRETRKNLPWYVNCRFASYIPLSKRLEIYKEMRAIERDHDAHRRKQEEKKRRAKEYPKLLARIRELEEKCKLGVEG